MGEKKNGTRWGLIGGVGVASILALGALSSSQFAADTQTQTQTAAIVNSVATSSSNDDAQIATSSVSRIRQESASEQKPTTTPHLSGNDLSNDHTYTNVSGHQVHSPAYDVDGDIPAGASARCSDGTYSFSEHHRGTCSHHGGVAQWL